MVPERDGLHESALYRRDEGDTVHRGQDGPVVQVRNVGHHRHQCRLLRHDSVLRPHAQGSALTVDEGEQDGMLLPEQVTARLLYHYYTNGIAVNGFDGFKQRYE